MYHIGSVLNMLPQFYNNTYIHTSYISFIYIYPIHHIGSQLNRPYIWLYLDCKNNTDQMYSCPRDFYFSASWGPNWGPPMNPPYITQHYRIEEVQGGALKWPSIMPRGASLADNVCEYLQFVLHPNSVLSLPVCLGLGQDL